MSLRRSICILPGIPSGNRYVSFENEIACIMSLRGLFDARLEKLRPYLWIRIESWRTNAVPDFLHRGRNKSNRKIGFPESGSQNQNYHNLRGKFRFFQRTYSQSVITFAHQLSILLHKSVLRFSERASEKDNFL